jgi:hypothetical protein
MEKKEYLGEFNYSLLHEELEVLPGYLTLEDDERIAHYALLPEEGKVTVGIEVGLEFPDAVMLAHDPKEKSKSEKDKDIKLDKRDAVLDKLGITLEEFKDLMADL